MSHGKKLRIVLTGIQATISEFARKVVACIIIVAGKAYLKITVGVKRRCRKIWKMDALGNGLLAVNSKLTLDIVE